MFCGVCGVRDDYFLFGLMVCALVELSCPDGINKIPIPDGQREFSDTLPRVTRAGACGGPRLAWNLRE